MNNKRINRIGSEIKRVISELIRESIKDPRVSDMTTISDVKVSSDLGYADVAVSILGDEKVKKETIEGLDNAKGFIKKELGQRLDLRHIPEIRFAIDDTVEKGMHIQELISQIHQKEKNND